MCAIETFRVNEEGVQTGFSTKVNGFTTILGSRKILRIGMDDALTNCVEACLLVAWNVGSGCLSDHLLCFSVSFEVRFFALGVSCVIFILLVDNDS